MSGDSYLPSANPYVPLTPIDKHSRRRSGRFRTSSSNSVTFFPPSSSSSEWPRQQQLHQSSSWFGGKGRSKALVVFGVGAFCVIYFLVGKLGSRVDPAVVRAAEEAAAAAPAEPTPDAPPPPGPAPPAPTSGPLDRLYLLPGRIGEQESKSSSHLYQIGLLALALNRTLVLPHAGLGYMGQCRPLDFEAWYSPSALDEWGIASVSQSAFRSRLEAANRVSTTGPVLSRFISLGGPSEARTSEVRMSTAGSAQAFSEGCCLDRPGRSNLAGMLQFPPDRPAAIIAPISWHKTTESQLAWGRDVIRLISSSTDLSTVPVLTVVWGSNYPGFSLSATPIRIPPFLAPGSPPRQTETFHHLAYSSALESLADQIVDHLGGPDGIVAVHWRQETVPLPHLSPCGDALISSLTSLRSSSSNVAALWMASDYPFEEAERGAAGDPISANSGTFTKSLTRAHHEAMSAFLSSLASSRPRTPVFKSLHAVARQLDPPLDMLSLDRGTAGILDKLVSARANWFLAGRFEGEGYCGRASSYTRSIVAMRQERGKSNGIAYFGP